MCRRWAMAKELRLKSAVTEARIRRGYLRRWDDEFVLTFRILDAKRWWSDGADVRLPPAQADGTR